jgi:hypothetical protein
MYCKCVDQGETLETVSQEYDALVDWALLCGSAGARGVFTRCDDSQPCSEQSGIVAGDGRCVIDNLINNLPRGLHFLDR